jgi:hypothetical protein
VLRGWGSSDNVDKRKKEAYPPAGTSLQEFAHRYNYSCEEMPAGSICSCWLRRLLFASGTTSAVSSTWYVLAGIPVGLYLPVFTCREKAYIAMQKEETWIGQFNMRLGI